MELLAPGDVVFDRFRVDEHGRGGGQSFGFKGTDLKAPANQPWDKEVFVKQYHDLIPGSQSAKGLGTHFKALNSRLDASKHYLCLPLFVGEVRNSVVAIFPYLNGRSLKDLLLTELPLESRARIALALANAIRVIHKSGIAHLDLKPENVIVEENKRTGELYTRLIDTDASMIDGKGLRQEQYGSPYYMSPEHFAPSRFGAVSEMSDVYSLGIILSELLMYKYPYDCAESSYEIKATAEGFDFPSSKIHRDVVRQIMATLRANPALRPAAGRLHSVLHSHYATKFVADSVKDQWWRTYVRLTSPGFERSYFSGTVLGRNNLRGASLGIVPPRILHLRLNERGATIELVDNSMKVRLGERSLQPGQEHALKSGEGLFFPNGAIQVEVLQEGQQLSYR